MKLAKIKNRIKSVVMASALGLTLLAGFPAVEAQAASGSVYTCTINRSYSNPVTGEVEDAGGASSYATGQGMVEGCVYPTGLLELTDDGSYYLTIKMSLMDYTSGHSFQVQNYGDSGWSTPSEIGITGNGTDSNGTTSDICMKVPSENCIIRGSMYVEPMGRDVVFFLYPSNFSEGNSSGMNATIVTEASGSGTNSSSSAQSSESGSSVSAGNSSLQSSESASSESGSSNKKLQSSITEAAKPSSESETPSTDSSTLDSAEGLSLSTAKDADAADSDSTSTSTSGNKVFQIAIAVLVVGLILIGVVAAVVFYFRKNWRPGEVDRTMMNRRLKKASAVLLAMTMLFSLAGCVDQSQGKKSSDSGTKTESSTDTSSESAESLLKITDPKEKAAVEAAKKKVQELDGEPRIIATSPATADICDKLELDLVGVCSSTVSTIPDRYKDVETVGTAMSPDTEILSSLKPDWILSPVSLQSDLQPKYEAIGSDWAFLNLRSVPGMYRSIQELGEIFDRQDQADKLVKEFTEFYDDYKKKNEGKDHPKVMILMGLPGSYIIATPNSYVGSLVELAGGENVYSDTDQEFLTVNTEDMKTKEPDIILRAAHALPDQVVEMFNKDFAENDIWQHFDAVKNGRVYDLTYEYFGMSATFKYPQALEELQPILYPASDEDTQKAKEASDNAQKKAKDSDATEKYNEQQKESK